MRLRGAELRGLTVQSGEQRGPSTYSRVTLADPTEPTISSELWRTENCLFLNSAYCNKYIKTTMLFTLDTRENL